MIPFTLEYFLSRSWWVWLRSVGFLCVISSKKVILIQFGFFFIIGCYRQSDWTISRMPNHLDNFCHLTSALQTIIHSGFALWSLACGLISTITRNSHKVELVIFMLMAGAGAGQVLSSSPSIISALKALLIRLYKHLRLQHKLALTEEICRLWLHSEMWVFHLTSISHEYHSFRSSSDFLEGLLLWQLDRQ